ncbi:hypothetical protein Ndes2526A_g03698 [Nannochloris sp. 'desiccata']
MDSLPSINLDELMKPDTAILGNDLCEGDGIPCTFIEDLEGLDDLLPLSPKGPIDLDPIISLPGMVPQTSTAFHSSEGSGAASEEQIDPTFHIEEEEEEDEEQAKPKRKARGGRAAASGAPKDPKERIRAKNRRAQARYREKQKAKREETSEVLEQATADLERLRLENSRLLSRKEIMENVLVVRDHSVGILEKSREAEEKTKQPGGILLSTSDKQMQTRFQRLLPTAPGVGGAGAGKLSSSTCGTACPAPCNKPQKQQSTSGTTNNADKNIDINEEHEEEDHRDCPLANLTVAEMIAAKATTNEEVRRRYKFYSEHLLDNLKQIEDPRASSHTRETAEESMMGILYDTGCMCFESAVLKPTIFQKLLVVSVVDDDSGNDIVKAAKWAEITRSLNLSDAQRQKMQPVREVFLQRAGRIAAERKKLLTSLNTATAAVSGTNTALTNTATAAGAAESLHSLQDITSNWLALHEKTQALEANLMEEHLACMELVAKCFGGVLTPLQKAKAIVASYPDFPDVFAIATAAAVEQRAGDMSPADTPLYVAAAAAAAGGEVRVQ